MRYNPQTLRDQILDALPEGFVMPEHSERGHWYRVNDLDHGTPLYPSVTGKLQILKDEGLANWKMNKALEHVLQHWTEFNELNIFDHIEKASQISTDIFHDAGDIGTTIHSIRERIFDQWIATGVRPGDFQSFITDDIRDIRAVSAIAALEKFCIEHNYRPIITEFMVYSHKWQTAGQLDDIGLMNIEIRPGTPGCDHLNNDVFGSRRSCIISDPDKNFDRCMRCGAKWKVVLVLLDLKTSNRFKDHYFFQVAMYYAMFRKLTGLKPDHAFILKVSKENRTYALEELKRPATIAAYANHVLKANDGLKFIKTLRKDNQKKVITI